MVNDLLWDYTTFQLCAVCLCVCLSVSHWFIEINRKKGKLFLFFFFSLVLSSGINNIRGLLIEKSLELEWFLDVQFFSVLESISAPWILQWKMKVCCCSSSSAFSSLIYLLSDCLLKWLRCCGPCNFRIDSLVR